MTASRWKLLGGEMRRTRAAATWPVLSVVECVDLGFTLRPRMVHVGRRSESFASTVQFRHEVVVRFVEALPNWTTRSAKRRWLVDLGDRFHERISATTCEILSHRSCSRHLWHRLSALQCNVTTECHSTCMWFLFVCVLGSHFLFIFHCCCGCCHLKSEILKSVNKRILPARPNSVYDWFVVCGFSDFIWRAYCSAFVYDSQLLKQYVMLQHGLLTFWLNWANQLFWFITSRAIGEASTVAPRLPVVPCLSVVHVCRNWQSYKVQIW